MDLDIGPEPNRSAGGLLRSLTRMLATLVALAQTRLELLTTELQEEVQRAAEELLSGDPGLADRLVARWVGGAAVFAGA